MTVKTAGPRRKRDQAIPKAESSAHAAKRAKKESAVVKRKTAAPKKSTKLKSGSEARAVSSTSATAEPDGFNGLRSSLDDDGYDQSKRKASQTADRPSQSEEVDELDTDMDGNEAGNAPVEAGLGQVAGRSQAGKGVKGKIKDAKRKVSEKPISGESR